MFEPLRVHAMDLRSGRWPDLDDLGRLLARRSDPIRTAGGATLKLVAQAPRAASWRERYEARIFLRGEMQMRERNWHDLLNLLTWLAFPKTKAAVNARHYAALQEQLAVGARNRGPAQDALTLFDEGGVIVASADKTLTRCLRGWRWKELFWQRRALLPAKMHFYVFGHALYEKALQPFTGITGRGILWTTGPELLAAPLEEQLPVVDAAIAHYLSDTCHLSATRELEVVPVLGVPGWFSENEHEAYYDDIRYFRPARTRDGTRGEG